MMGPDEYGERRQVSHMPAIALSIAALLLLIVAALSYRDYVRSGFEKEFAEKEARLMQRQGYYDSVAPGQSIVPNPGPVQAQTPFPPAGSIQSITPEPSQPLVAGSPYESSMPLPNDPDLEKMRQSLEQAREQSRRTEERYNNLAVAEGAAVQAETEITAKLPEFLREAVENPPGGNPEVEARLQKMRDTVSAAPSLAKVTSYNKDWGIVTFNAGAGQGVKVDQRFAVRRGSEVLGWVKVDQVEEGQSIAVLVTKNRDSDTSAKPEVGDDLIDFELF